MTSSDRLAEAARNTIGTMALHHDEFGPPSLLIVTVFRQQQTALAAYDADLPRRQAERAVIDAAIQRHGAHTEAACEVVPPRRWNVSYPDPVCVAVRRLREFDEKEP